jgi:hypothetical protein
VAVPWNRGNRQGVIRASSPIELSFRNAPIVAVFLLLGTVSPSSAGEQAIKVHASDKAACLPDAVRLCREAMPNVYNVLVCFGNHRDKISHRCLAVLASYGLR